MIFESQWNKKQPETASVLSVSGCVPQSGRTINPAPFADSFHSAWQKPSWS